MIIEKVKAGRNRFKKYKMRRCGPTEEDLTRILEWLHLVQSDVERWPQCPFPAIEDFKNARIIYDCWKCEVIFPGFKAGRHNHPCTCYGVDYVREVATKYVLYWMTQKIKKKALKC